ncbi:hypothetical protein KC953_03745, partial [Candidatus Saccharibacteria bacterium]|nr:hypothetical protein [Candidatus Saccharibacteria bacterium]
LSTIDAASQAVQDIENYVSYINNEMPDDYMALAQITQNHNDSTWLYEMSEDGSFEPVHQVWNMSQFMGNEIILHDNEVFLLNKKHGVAVKPLESITMINATENPRKSRHLEIKILSAKKLTEQRKKIARRAINANEL